MYCKHAAPKREQNYSQVSITVKRVKISGDLPAQLSCLCQNQYCERDDGLVDSLSHS